MIDKKSRGFSHAVPGKLLNMVSCNLCGNAVGLKGAGSAGQPDPTNPRYPPVQNWQRDTCCWSRLLEGNPCCDITDKSTIPKRSGLYGDLLAINIPSKASQNPMSGSLIR